MSVESIIQSQLDFATDAVAGATVLIDRLTSLADSGVLVDPVVGEIPVPGYAFDVSQTSLELLQSLFPSAIDVDPISATAPTFTPDTIDSLPDVVVPDFTKTAPVMDIPAPPSTLLPSVPTAPAIGDIVLPDAPTLTFPDAPEISGITFPDVPSIEIPTFTSSLPVVDLVVPTNNFSFFEQLYQSSLLDALTAKLLADLENGGYGIEPNDEAALWDRARSRELENAMSEVEMLIANAAGRGFPLPPGDLNVALQRSHQDTQNKISTLNRDIALKRADLFAENRRFTIEQAKQTEQILIGYHNSVMERALNVARATFDAVMKIYDAEAARFNSRLDAYKAEAQVFEARVRAAVSQIEIYRVQMQGKQIEAEVQRAQVDVYNARLNGINAVVNLYKARMEAAQVQAGIERLKIEAFRGLVDAFGAQVQAKVAEFNMFEAQIKGETARMQAFGEEVKAYTAIVDASKIRSDINIARLRAQLDEAAQHIKVFEVQMEAYKTDISAQAQTIDAKVKVYGSQVQGASAEAGAISEAYRLDVARENLEFKRNVENAKIAIEKAKISMESLLASAKIRVDAAGHGSDMYKAFAASSVNSINTLTSLISNA